MDKEVEKQLKEQVVELQGLRGFWSEAADHYQSEGDKLREQLRAAYDAIERLKQERDEALEKLAKMTDRYCEELG